MSRGQYSWTHVGASPHARALVHTLEMKQRYDNARAGAVTALLKDLSTHGMVSSIGNNQWDVALKDGAWVRLLWYPEWNALEATVSDRELHRVDDATPFHRHYAAILDRITPRLRQHGATVVAGAFLSPGPPWIGLSEVEEKRLWDKAKQTYCTPRWSSTAPSSSAQSSFDPSREFTNEEAIAATEAGNRAVAPLVAQRYVLMQDWKEDAKLSRDQMLKIMDAAVQAANKTVEDLSTMIAKVPSHMEDKLTPERTLINEQIDKAGTFSNLIAAAKDPTVIPGFRKWILGLLSKIEDGIVAIGHVAHLLPNWLRMRDLLSKLYEGAIRLIGGIARFIGSAGGAALDLAEKLPTIAKVLGIGALVLGGVLVVSKVRARA